MKTTTKSGIPSVLLAVATVVLTSTVHAAPAVTQADLVQAVADGQAFGNAVQTTPMTPTQQSAAASQGVSGTTMSSIAMPPGANNVMGSQYTGTPDPQLTGLVTSPSLNGTGTTAKNNSVNGFSGYSNAPADQANQAAYFVTTGNIHRQTIAPNDPLVTISQAQPVPTGNSSGSSTACVTTVNSPPGNLGIPHVCIDSFDPYVTTCSKDKNVSVIMVPVCNATINAGSSFATAQPPMSQPPQVSCISSTVQMINLGTTSWSSQCYTGNCAAYYYDFVMFVQPGYASSSCGYTATSIFGIPQGLICATYNGIDTISIAPWTMADANSSPHPGGTVVINGGWTYIPQLSYGPNIDNCVPLQGFL